MTMLVMNAHRWNKERKTNCGKTRDNDNGTHWAHTKNMHTSIEGNEMAI